MQMQSMKLCLLLSGDSQVSAPVPDSNAADDENDSGPKRHKSEIDTSIERIHENEATEAPKDPHAGKVSDDISAPFGAKASGIPTADSTDDETIRPQKRQKSDFVDGFADGTNQENEMLPENVAFRQKDLHIQALLLLPTMLIQ
jgi:hypothetical protein